MDPNDMFRNAVAQAAQTRTPGVGFGQHGYLVDAEGNAVVGGEIPLAPPRPASPPSPPQQAQPAQPAPTPIVASVPKPPPATIAWDEVANVKERATQGSSLAQQFRQQREARGMQFMLLYSTPHPFPVRVERPGIAYLAMTGRIPHTLRDVVDKMLEDRKQGASDAETEKALNDRLQVNMQTLEDIQALWRATCIAGFVDPVLYEPHPADVSRLSDGTPADPLSMVPVTFVAPQDQERFFSWCNTQDEEEAKALRGFPE